MLELILLVLGVLISLIISLFVLTRNPRSIINRLYFLNTISFVVFAVGNFLSLQTDDRLFYIRTVIFSSVLAVSSLYYLLVYMSKSKGRLNSIQLFGIIYTGFLAAISFTPLVFSGLNPGPNPTPVPQFGAGLYLIHIVVFMGISFKLLASRAKNLRGNEKQQSIYMLVGLAPLFIFAPITGFILPIILKNPSLIFLSPVYSTFFIAMTGYAVVKHRLFDVRPIVARSLGYILSLFFVGALYAFVTFEVVNSLLLDNSSLNPTQQVYFILLAIGMAFTFQPIKRFFDRYTNKLFYQDAYDTQSLLDELNQVLVATLDLEDLLTQSAKIIEENIKSKFCVFLINNSHTYLEIPSKETRINREVLVELDNLGHQSNENIFITDYLDDKNSEQKKILNNYEISIAIRLKSKSNVSTRSVGYLLLGLKKSGNPYNKQDLKVLEIIVNELVIAIENSVRFEEIQNFNITLQEKVKRATAQLEERNKRLVLLDQTKDDFISMASHQLRTPLTSVKGYLSMAIEGDAGELNDKQKDLLTQAFVSSERMVYLIGDMLNVSRLKTGKFVIDAAKINLADLIESEIEQLEGTAKARGLEMTYHKPGNFPELMLDETKMRQVIMNFADNAIYYTPKGGKIDVNLKDSEKSIEFTIKDTGIGVPKSERHQLFSKFFRAKNAKKARPDGTGLGLYMAKKVIVAQGGSIIFNSEEGKGSTFGFAFPKEKLLPEEQGSD